MSSTKNNLCNLLGSRICHDLISPLGAIGNGLELLSLGGADPNGPELSLITQSVENATARLKFFRLAFGAVSSSENAADYGAPMAASEIRAILADYAKDGRVSVVWQVDADTPRAFVRIGLLLILCLETAMPFGGEVTISQNGDGRWRVSGVARKMKINTALWEHLSRPDAEHPLIPAEVQFGLVQQALADAGRDLRVEISEAVGVKLDY